VETAFRIDAPDELAAFLLTLWIPLGPGARAEVVPLGGRSFEVHVLVDGDETDELEEQVTAAVEKWLVDCGLEKTTVHTGSGDLVVKREPGVGPRAAGTF
jgi:hypothetical protein